MNFGSIRNNALFAALKQQAMLGLTLPANRFFTPTEAFWPALKALGDVAWVDAGTGTGELVDEANSLGIEMAGLDIALRPKQSNRVLSACATTFCYGPRLCLLICRPSHDGWCEMTIDVALKQGAIAVYVGKPSNAATDLGKFYRCKKNIVKSVGKEGESMYVFKARK